MCCVLCVLCVCVLCVCVLLRLTCAGGCQAEARRILQQHEPQLGADVQPQLPDASDPAAANIGDRPQPTRWLRMERRGIDFEAARVKARARDPSLDPSSNTFDDETGQGSNADEPGAWRSSLPQWLPVERMAPGQHLNRLKDRLTEVEALLAAHQQAIGDEAGGAVAQDVVAQAESRDD